MRKAIDGNGDDSTAALAAYLAANHVLTTRFLYLIGEPDHPQAIWATDHEAPLLYKPWGKFLPAVISKSGITTKIGLDSSSVTVKWSPANRNFSQAVGSASPLALARIHYYDNWPVRIWKVYMPTPGDCSTYGAVEWFGGYVGDCQASRDGLSLTVDSFLSVVSQKLPANVIEVTNTFGSYTAATAPPGGSVPVFSCFTGSNETIVLGDCLSPTYGHVYDVGTFSEGYMIFLAGPNATLAGVWAAVGNSLKYKDGHNNEHNEFQLYNALPWPPTPGADTFYCSSKPPVSQGEQSYFGFPYVPAPQTAV
jgi:hypothetical protein